MAGKKAEPNTPDAAAEPVAKMPHVRSAVLAITAELAASGIGKDRTNQQQNFKFRGIDDIHNTLAPLYVKHKVIVLPAYANRATNEFTSKGGGRMVGVTIDGTYKIVSLVDGSELVSGPFIGEAMDSGDKGTNKAMSIAYKYYAIQTYSIPIVGNEDPDFEAHAVEPKRAAAPVAAKQQTGTTVVLPADGKVTGSTIKVPPANETVTAAIKRLSANKGQQKALGDLICTTYGVVVADQIPDDKRAEAISRLEAYVAKQAKKAA